MIRSCLPQKFINLTLLITSEGTSWSEKAKLVKFQVVVYLVQTLKVYLHIMESSLKVDHHSTSSARYYPKQVQKPLFQIHVMWNILVYFRKMSSLKNNKLHGSLSAYLSHYIYCETTSCVFLWNLINYLESISNNHLLGEYNPRLKRFSFVSPKSEYCR